VLKRGAQLLVGLLILGSVPVWSPEAATSAPSSCGRPDDAPGFETPARRNVVPDVVCMDLQLAQDKAQAARLTRIRVEDASGQGRRKLNDQDWVVVDQSPPPGTRAKWGTRLVFRVLAYGDPDAPPMPDRARPGRMPDLRCFDLQEAQDTLQSAGFYQVTSRDATRRGRRQYVDRNWTVTEQSPAPGGTHRKSTRVTLRVVKDREPSPC
jgi:beta-lactam-binding protein with PASTA domain